MIGGKGNPEGVYNNSKSRENEVPYSFTVGGGAQGCLEGFESPKIGWNSFKEKKEEKREITNPNRGGKEKEVKNQPFPTAIFLPRDERKYVIRGKRSRVSGEKESRRPEESLAKGGLLFFTFS